MAARPGPRCCHRAPRTDAVRPGTAAVCPTGRRDGWIPSAPSRGGGGCGGGASWLCRRDAKPPMCSPHPLPVSPPAPQPRVGILGTLGPLRPTAVHQRHRPVLPSWVDRDPLEADGIQLRAAARGTGCRGERGWSPGAPIALHRPPASPAEPELPREMGRLWDERRPRQGWDAAAVNQLLSSNKMDISHMK